MITIQKITRSYLVPLFCLLVVLYFIKDIGNEPIKSQNDTQNAVSTIKETSDGQEHK